MAKVYIVLSDHRERDQAVLGLYKSKIKAIKRANAYINNNNKDLLYLRKDYKELTPIKFYAQYGGSAWIQYAVVEHRGIN